MHPPSTEGNAPPQQASPQYKAPTSSGLQIPHMAQVNGRAPPGKHQREAGFVTKLRNE